MQVFERACYKTLDKGLEMGRWARLEDVERCCPAQRSHVLAATTDDSLETEFETDTVSSNREELSKSVFMRHPNRIKMG